VLSDTFQSLLEKGTQLFLDAAQNRGSEEGGCKAAIQAIERLERSLVELGESYAVQSISFRKQRQSPFSTLFAASVIPPSPTTSPELHERFASTFNAAAVQINWSDVETAAGRYDFDRTWTTLRWCQSRGLKVIAGPLIDFRERMLPTWLYLLEDDFDAFLDATVSFVERIVTTFRGQVHIWNCATGLNTPGPLRLDDEQVMRLSVSILQVIRRLDPNIPAVMTFDQPFGEYLSKHPEGISPLHFADALLRSGLGLAGIGLETNINYLNGTLPRSAVDFGQLIDRWATLGMPLLVQLTVPGGSGPDANAIAPSETIGPLDSQGSVEVDQLQFGGQLIRTLLAKQIVHGIVWNGWADSEPHVQSHSGLIDKSNDPRPLLDYLTRLRRDVLAVN
jgi:hypothetical protein